MNTFAPARCTAFSTGRGKRTAAAGAISLRRFIKTGLIFVPGTALAPPSLSFYGKSKGGNGLLNGLLGYWKFDEASGNAIDATGNGWTGTIQGSYAATTGKINNGRLETVAENQGFSVSASIDNRSNTSPFTVTCWFSNAGASGGGQAIIGEWDATHTDWVLSNNLTGEQCHFASKDNTGTLTTTSSTALTITTFMFLVFGYDGTNIFFSVNNGTLATAAVNNVRRAETVLALGNYSNFNAGWPGVLDEVGYWNRALGATDRTNLYNGGNGLAFPNFTN